MPKNTKGSRKNSSYRYGKVPPKKGYSSRRHYRNFVPRTMGPFAASESKYFDSFKESLTLDEASAATRKEADPATLNTLFCPQEGSDIDNRIGRKVAVHKIVLKMVLVPDVTSTAAAAVTGSIVRIGLVIDEQTNGTQAQSEDVYEAIGTPTVPNNANYFQNKANFGRFRVLKDKCYPMGPAMVFNDAAGTGTYTFQEKCIKWTRKFVSPVIVKFNGTNGGTVGDIVDNSFHLYAWKNNGAGNYALSYTCRTYYKDM